MYTNNIEDKQNNNVSYLYIRESWSRIQVRTFELVRDHAQDAGGAGSILSSSYVHSFLVIEAFDMRLGETDSLQEAAP